eukprot:gene2383-2687_t
MSQMWEGGNSGPDSYLTAVQDPITFDDIAAGRRKLQQGRIWGSAGPRSWQDSGIGPYPLVLPIAAARRLQQNPATYVSIKGQQPGGFYAVGDKAEASAAASSRGIRYNNGRVIIAGDGYPGARSSSTTGDAAARSAPTPSDANTNLGIQTIASQGLWARAVAGSGVGFTGASKSPNALTNNIASFKPNNQHSRDTSTAFTEITAESSAVSGAGNGPAAMSWGYETGAAARAARSTPEPLQHGSQAARLLKQDPASFTSTDGHTPEGIYALGDIAEASAAGATRGIRYNGGNIVGAGDAVPSARSSSTTGDAAARSAGSGVSFTAGSEDGGKHINANSSNVKLFKPSSVHKSGSSIAFTDISQGSSAVAGIGIPQVGDNMEVCGMPAIVTNEAAFMTAHVPAITSASIISMFVKLQRVAADTCALLQPMLYVECGNKVGNNALAV